MEGSGLSCFFPQQLIFGSTRIKWFGNMLHAVDDSDDDADDDHKYFKCHVNIKMSKRK